MGDKRRSVWVVEYRTKRVKEPWQIECIHFKSAKEARAKVISGNHSWSTIIHRVVRYDASKP